MHTTKRNKRQQKQNRTHLKIIKKKQKQKKRETRERSLTKTKATGKKDSLLDKTKQNNIAQPKRISYFVSYIIFHRF